MFNLEKDGDHLVPGQENMVDDAFLKICILVLQLVQHATGEQVHCHAKQGYMSQLSLALLFNCNAVSKVSQYPRLPVIVTLCGTYQSAIYLQHPRRKLCTLSYQLKSAP